MVMTGRGFVAFLKLRFKKKLSILKFTHHPSIACLLLHSLHVVPINVYTCHIHILNLIIKSLLVKRTNKSYNMRIFSLPGI